MEYAAMNEAAIRKQLSDLIQAITSSPFAGQPNPGSLQGVYQADASGQQAPLGSSLDYLQLQVKYLLFDLEATRRENRYLRQMLESRHKRDLEDFRGEGPETP